MKSRFLRTFVATPIMAAMLIPMGAAAQTQATNGTTVHRYHSTQRTTPKRRTKKKSAIIVGGSGLAGAGIGALAGGKKGAVIGGLAGAGTGYVYDRKSQKKPIIPK